MNKYLERIKSIVPEFDEKFISFPFYDAGIDSMDMLTIRVEFEGIIGREFLDSEWLSFETLEQIIKFCQGETNESITLLNALKNNTGKKIISINMPQMAIGALSENWLFKELGDMHWDMLCDGLDTPSLQVKDENGNRLYATFVRIRIQSTKPFNEFYENDKLEFESKIMRFGNGMYFSDIMLQSQNEKIDANLMTSFSIRNEVDNTKLMKSQPSSKANTIVEYDHEPEFGNNYRLIKKGITKSHQLGDFIFMIGEESVFTTTYKLNPYYDLNGVGLLYFAAYPIINNTCEALFFNERNEEDTPWEINYHIVARDILYYANCNISDRILYQLNNYEFLDGDKIKITSTLYRKSDMVMMAKIFTVKIKRK